MKNVLVIYYTQSGQLAEIAQNLSSPLREDDTISVDFHEIRPVKPFPFPWDKKSFFEVFPESFLQLPVELERVPIHILEKKYDLVLLHYQVWYLSPSIPVNSFLQSEEAKLLLRNTPVITISGSRNMWIMAQEKIKKLLTKANAILKGNIALVDRAGNLISVVTIVEWMFTGKKSNYLGVFPLPGISSEDISGSVKFGDIIKKHLLNDSMNQLQPELIANNAVRVKSFLVVTDRTGNKIFKKWANFIKSRNKTRKNWLKVFYVYLFLAIWVISPIVYILHLLTYPLKRNKIKKESEYFKGI